MHSVSKSHKASKY